MRSPNASFVVRAHASMPEVRVSGRMLFKAKITLKLDAPEETNLPVDDKQACTRQRLKEELFNEVPLPVR